MKLVSKQRGLTAISWVVIIAIAVLFITLLLRLIPIYIEGFSVYESLEAMGNDKKVAKYQTAAIKKSLLTRLNINSVYSVTRDDIYVTKKGGKTTIEVDYEKRENVVGNLDLVVSFRKSVTIE